MIQCPIPDTEPQRLAALDRYGVVGTGPEQVYDDLSSLAAKVLGCPMAGLSFVTGDSVWFKSCYGAKFSSVPRMESFCAYTVCNVLDPTTAQDASRDPRFIHSRLVSGQPFIRAYAGVPLMTPDFQAIGTLCVMDTEPRLFTGEQLEMLRTLARLAVSQLELRRQAILLTAANEKLRTLASCDSLTGLRNHRAFQERLEDELLYASRHGSSLSLILIDIDHFKDYNDRYGHPAGDVVLQAVGIMLLESSREYDLVARYGGEEFAVILRGAGEAEAYAVAERLRAQVEAGNWPLRPITISLGVASFSPQLRTREALVEEADRLLYLAKGAGKNCVRSSVPEDLFDPAQWVAAMERCEDQGAHAALRLERTRA